MKEEVKEGIVLTVSILIIIGFVYFITATIKTGEIGKNKTTTTKSNEVTNMYDNMIMAKDTFSKEGEYMVIFFSEKNAKDSIKSIMKSYSGSTKLYKVNLDEKVNSYVLSGDENRNATNADELKLKDTTLIKISNGIISDYITDKKQILEQLQ